MCTLFNRGIFNVLLNVLKLKIHFKFFPVQAIMKHFLTCMVQVQNYLKCKLKKDRIEKNKERVGKPLLHFHKFYQLNISVHPLSEQSKQYIICNMYWASIRNKACNTASMNLLLLQNTYRCISSATRECASYISHHHDNLTVCNLSPQRHMVHVLFYILKILQHPVVHVLADKIKTQPTKDVFINNLHNSV